MRALWCPMLFLVAFCGMQAQLTTKTTDYGSKPGYIDKATLVVQPHGAYVEQALYLSYGDHGAFGSNPNVEIVHRFRLPANAVVNDLWLWIGDSVMQAIVLDVWRARTIYDSITSSLHDPAFLAKKGDTYELHIFPLISGQVRRIRMNFLVPARWAGTAGNAELPLGMLMDNNAAVKPLEVRIRTVDQSWGRPAIKEAPNLVYDTLPDSHGFKFLVTNIPDLTPLRGLTMTFHADLEDGSRVTSASQRNDNQSWFEYGLDPVTVFQSPADTVARKHLFALDLSGLQDRVFTTLLPELRELMRAAASPHDSVALVVSGAGRVARVHEGWIPARTGALDTLVSLFGQGTHGADINARTVPRVEYCDENAALCWQFPGITSLAQIHRSSSLFEALYHGEDPNVIATYDHNRQYLSQTLEKKDTILAMMDAALNRGARILTYIDEGHYPEIEGVFFDSVKFSHFTHDKVETLFRAQNGNFGDTFPETVEHLHRGYITYSDSVNIKPEVVDSQGRAVVISRRVGKGLLVLSSLWSFRADGALRGLVGAPLLGLNSTTGTVCMLEPLMDEARRIFEAEGYNDLVLLSNGDSVYSVESANERASQYRAGFPGSFPSVTTVNLLRASGYTPPFVTDANVRYYGSGLLLQRIAAAFSGQYIAGSAYSWSRICDMVMPAGFIGLDSLFIGVDVQGGTGALRLLREVAANPSDLRKVRYFQGETSSADSVRLTATGFLRGDPQPRVHQRTVYLTRDSADMNWTIPPMLANEQVRELLAAKPPLDTTRIMSLAKKHRLLCDFTAFLALEPNDTLRFKRDPGDDGGTNDVAPIDFSSDGDSLAVVVTPNPFRGSTRIAVRAPEGSEVTITLFDMLGRAVRTVSSSPQASRMQVYTWNGADAQNTPLPAGIYFVHVLSRSPFHAAPLSVVRRVVRME